MSGKQFTDTNVLIYAHDLDAGFKRERAASILHALWETGTGVISVQVLQEFYVNVTRKIPEPLTLADARGLISAYCAWQVETPTAGTALNASEIQERNQLSFWDAMIVATAVQSGADTLLSEDLNHGQIIEGIRVENPFLH
ncbi:MAG: PIN domain-containing protein [Nitrococcus mobilis]|nr:PIN domain-containing protein [Nitrococcus mobilis]